MAESLHHLVPIVAMAVLVIFSGFFSGVETAFFNLTRRQCNDLKKSPHRLHQLAAQVLSKPGKLLSCLLFGNMMANVMYFAIFSLLLLRVQKDAGMVWATVAAGVGFLMIILFGEIFPKTISMANSKGICLAAVVPVFVFIQILSPLVFVFRFLIAEPALRLILGPEQQSKEFSTGEFKSLIESVRQSGLITDDENRLLTEIVEIGFLKVRHVMKPRVDMNTCDIRASVDHARQLMMDHNLTKLPVYRGNIDNIVAMVHLRSLYLEPQKPLRAHARPVHFVPEQKTVESLLEFFRRAHIDTAIVVDEYGGIAGTVQLEDVAEEVFGPLEAAKQIDPIEQIGPFQYRLSGNLAIHDWVDAFGIDLEETKIATIAGLVTAALGKVPKSGDVARLKNLSFTIEKVRQRRIETVILKLEPFDAND